MKIKLLNNFKKIKQSNLPLIIGYFGCIHVMHNEILNSYHEFNVLTFKDSQFKLDHQIYNFNDRISNLRDFQIQNCYVYDIDKNNITAQNFIDLYLKKINPSIIMVGADFKLGSDQKEAKFLMNYFKMNIVGYHSEVSSLIIFKYLKENKIQEANNFLLKPYYYKSKWISGRKRGRKLGYKTVNLKLDHQLVIEYGVFACKLVIGSKSYKGVAFYGPAATFSNKKPSLEIHVLNKKLKSRLLYLPHVRDNVKVEFYEFLRPVYKFGDSKTLVEAIKKDIQDTITFFNENNL